VTCQSPSRFASHPDDDGFRAQLPPFLTAENQSRQATHVEPPKVAVDLPVQPGFEASVSSVISTSATDSSCEALRSENHTVRQSEAQCSAALMVSSFDNRMTPMAIARIQSGANIRRVQWGEARCSFMIGRALSWKSALPNR
jgi:hypothetical protein